jgi:hypothetical protein
MAPVCVGAEMSTSTEIKPTVGARIVGVLMILGGILGIVGSICTIIYFAQQLEYSRIVVPSCSIPLFAWIAWIGGGYAYEFSTGLSVHLSVDGFVVPRPVPSHNVNVGAHLGSLFNLNLTGEEPRWMVGTNLVALGVLIYLFRLSRVSRANVSTPTAEDVNAAIENQTQSGATGRTQ